MKSRCLPFLAAAAVIVAATLRAQEVPPPLTPPTVRRITPPAVPLPNPPIASPQPAAIPPPTAPDPNALKWDADSKEANPQPGELSVPFTFVVTNVSDHEVTINTLRTSCGCTVAQLPSTPYKLEPGANVPIAVTLDLRGKSGTLTKTVSVESSAGVKSLIVRANIPQAAPGVLGAMPATAVSVAGLPVSVPGTPLQTRNVAGSPVFLPGMPERLAGVPRAQANAPVAVPGVPDTATGVPVAPPRTPVVVRVANAAGDRAMNIQNALADRQAVFKEDCATCHVDKGVGKLGAELYAASCGICHDAEHRATMVPDLKAPRSPRDLAFWQKWIAEGKSGTLMPAFASVHGGPLTQEQADSLTVYLYQYFPRNPPAAPVPAPLQTTAPPPEPSETIEAQISIGNSNQLGAQKP